MLVLWRVLIKNLDNEVLYKTHKNKFNGVINNNEVLYIYKKEKRKKKKRKKKKPDPGKEKQAYQIKIWPYS